MPEPRGELVPGITEEREMEMVYRDVEKELEATELAADDDDDNVE